MTLCIIPGESMHGKAPYPPPGSVDPLRSGDHDRGGGLSFWEFVGQVQA